MKSTLIFATFFALACPAVFAGSPFDQLGQIEEQNKKASEAVKAEQQRKADAERSRQQALDEDYRRKKLASDQKLKVQALKASEQKVKEKNRIRSREESFEDELRALELEERKLSLQAKKAHVARTDEFIDAELRDRAAITDVVQSEADATRNVSEGAKALMKSSGEADINRSNSVFKK